MNYNTLYLKITIRGIRLRDNTTYYERHHILPKCMGGVDENNITYLTPREHYIAHWLLCKIHKDMFYKIVTENFPCNLMVSMDQLVWR